MYQRIGEKISVVGIYTSSTFQVKKFQWQQREFRVEKVNEVHDFRDGMMRKRRFSLLTDGNVYLIEFNRDTEVWTLEQIWMEG